MGLDAYYPIHKWCKNRCVVVGVLILGIMMRCDLMYVGVGVVTEGML